MPLPGRDDRAMSETSRNQPHQMNVLQIHEAMTDDELEKIDRFITTDPDMSH